MMRKAMSVPATGEMTMAARIFEMPFHFRSPNPREATTAPMIPPMIACEAEGGVAVAFAVSWKPLMKSKASAAKTTSPRRTGVDSAIFQRNSFEDVGGVFATVGGGLERLVALLH